MKQSSNSLLTIILSAMLAACFSAVALAQSEPAKRVPTTQPKVRIALVGDSIVAGWGKPFGKCFTGEVQVTNLAMGGRSSKSFIAEGYWQKALDLKPDYVLIQFGHNDQPGHSPQIVTDPQTSYRQFMVQYVDQAIAAGIKPVLVTSLSRREWDAQGKIKSSLQPYVDVIEQIAAEKNVPLINLHRRSIELYEKLGRDKVNELSARTPPTPAMVARGEKEGTIDGSHLNEKGSEVVAQILAEELKAAVPAMAPYVK